MFSAALWYRFCNTSFQSAFQEPGSGRKTNAGQLGAGPRNRAGRGDTAPKHGGGEGGRGAGFVRGALIWASVRALQAGAQLTRRYGKQISAGSFMALLSMARIKSGN